MKTLECIMPWCRCVPLPGVATCGHCTPVADRGIYVLDL